MIVVIEIHHVPVRNHEVLIASHVDAEHPDIEYY